MEGQRYQRGFEKLEEVNKEGIDDLIQLMEDIAPDLATYVIEFAYGDVYTRPGLDSRQRELCIISAITALGGKEQQLKDHIQAAINVGCTKVEIVETLIMMAVYGRISGGDQRNQSCKRSLMRVSSCGEHYSIPSLLTNLIRY